MERHAHSKAQPPAAPQATPHSAPNTASKSEARPEPRIELRRLSHDVKNALNGVAVNLEVARARAANGVTDASQFAPFLDTAAQQLEVVVKLHKQFAELAAELARHS